MRPDDIRDPPWVWDEELEVYRLDETLPHLWTEGLGPEPFGAEAMEQDDLQGSTLAD